MTIPDSRQALDQAVASRRLLDHPYYRAWQAGELTVDDLAGYAAQYRHVEQVLPVVLELTVRQLPAGRARQLVEENLADESGRPRPHLELFDAFAVAVSADSGAPPSAATTKLVATYETAAQEGPVPALAVVGAYEVQAAEVAATKSAALRSHYDLTPAETEFWDVHAALEPAHADWTAEAMAELAPSGDVVSRYAEASAAAWWGFLDERESARRG